MPLGPWLGNARAGIFMTALRVFATQPWVRSPLFDSIFILGPALGASALVYFISFLSINEPKLGPLSWFILVVCIDVAHVYAAIFRTYLDKAMANRDLLWKVPLICWVSGFIFYLFDPKYFWTLLVYLAAYHFVRQQYGFAMIYARNEKSLPTICKQIDRIMIYAATLYPLIYWHANLPLGFTWFARTDFIAFIPHWVGSLAGWVYAFIITAFVLKELWLYFKRAHLNAPKALFILGTALAWFLGIVWFRNGLAFTITIVVSHGIPYAALVWVYGNKKPEPNKLRLFGQAIFSHKMVPVYLGILFILGYFEQGLWDGFIWRTERPIFSFFDFLPAVHEGFIRAIMVPLLAIPQATHYVLDAYVWRVSGKDSSWKQALLKT